MGRNIEKLAETRKTAKKIKNRLELKCTRRAKRSKTASLKVKTNLIKKTLSTKSPMLPIRNLRIVPKTTAEVIKTPTFETDNPLS